MVGALSICPRTCFLPLTATAHHGQARRYKRLACLSSTGSRYYTKPDSGARIVPTVSHVTGLLVTSNRLVRPARLPGSGKMHRTTGSPRHRQCAHTVLDPLAQQGNRLLIQLGSRQRRHAARSQLRHMLQQKRMLERTRRKPTAQNSVPTLRIPSNPTGQNSQSPQPMPWNPAEKALQAYQSSDYRGTQTERKPPHEWQQQHRQEDQHHQW